MKILTIPSHRKEELIDITGSIKEEVNSSRIETGICRVFVPHTTAGVTINEGADPSVQRDIIETLKQLIPERADYHHMEGNSDAHIKASLLGSSVNLIVDNNRLVLGTWQHVFFYEGDGPRNRRVFIHIIKNIS